MFTINNEWEFENKLKVISIFLHVKYHNSNFSKKKGLTGLCDILGICNGGEKVNNQALGEPYPSKSQSYPYSDIPFASSQVQSFVVAAPTKVND